MALGLSLMLGIRLPLNFNSPYKSSSIIEFWRRWHISLSVFLRDYLYVPLGGSKRGNRYFNLMITMLLGGLWHGAGWTFIVWSALHGLYLVINHFIRQRFGQPSSHIAIRTAKKAIVFLAVVIAWVFFRASTLGDALTMLGSMLGLHGKGIFQNYPALLWIGAGLSIVFFAPNTLQLFQAYRPALFNTRSQLEPTIVRWVPSNAWAISMAVVMGIGIIGIHRLSPFLYYQF